MQVIPHPRSGAPIEGLLLGPGATIRATDVYDSTTGAWEPSPTAGLRIEEGCRTFWVRPGPLSAAARSLLEDMVGRNLLLARRVNWRVIPSLEWAESGAMDWVVDGDAAKELLACGFISRVNMTRDVYEPTNTGRRALQPEYRPWLPSMP